MAAGDAMLRLEAVLGAVWASALPLAERRRLAARVAVAALGPGGGGGGDGSCDGVPTLGHMEEVLMEVAALDGKEKIGVSAAKAVLRGRGERGEAAAKRLSRLSRARNTAAHPDVGLVTHIRALADEPTVLDDGKEFTPSEAGAGSPRLPAAQKPGGPYCSASPRSRC